MNIIRERRKQIPIFTCGIMYYFLPWRRPLFCNTTSLRPNSFHFSTYEKDSTPSLSITVAYNYIGFCCKLFSGARAMSFSSVSYPGCRYLYGPTYVCSGYEQRLIDCSTVDSSYQQWLATYSTNMYGVSCGTGKCRCIYNFHL